MSTVSTVLTFSRTQVQTDSNGLTDTTGLIFANEALVDFRRRLTTAGVDGTGLQESYETMTGGVGTYLYPTNLAWLKAIELNYADSTQQNYVTAQQVDVSNLPNKASFSWLRLNASTSYPYFNDMGDWCEIFPTPVSTNAAGIRIWYFLTPTEYSSTSSTISYPESLDYRILGWRICANYLYSLRTTDTIAMGDKFNAKYDERVVQLISTLGQGSQQPLTATGIQDSGWNF